MLHLHDEEFQELAGLVKGREEVKPLIWLHDFLQGCRGGGGAVIQAKCSAAQRPRTGRELS